VEGGMVLGSYRSRSQKAPSASSLIDRLVRVVGGLGGMWEGCDNFWGTAFPLKTHTFGQFVCVACSGVGIGR
jgi:hypothetical protein